jgi:hypothetical protein
MNTEPAFLQRFFLRKIDHWQFWIAVAILIKVILLCFQITQDRPNQISGFIGHTSQDTNSYLEPIDNLILYDNYSPDDRLPGYAVLYLPLRLVFNKPLACNVLIILQMLGAAVSVYYLALTAQKAFHSEKLFYIVFYTFCLSSYTNLFDAYLLSDSPCTTATVFSVYFFVNYLQGENPGSLLHSGVFLSWAIFLRPVYAPLIVLFLVILLFHKIPKKNMRAFVKVGLLFIAPFTFVESVWIVRNYITHNKFIPVTPMLYSKSIEESYLLELMDFVKSWGGDRTWWNPGSEMRWFGVVESGSVTNQSMGNQNISIPSDIYTSRFNERSLDTIKWYISKINAEKTSIRQRVYYTAIVKKKLITYTESIKEEKPFLYYVKAPLLLFKRFFIHSGTYNLFNKTFNNLTLLEKAVKIFYSLVYLLVLFSGMLTLLIMVFRHHHNPSITLIAFVLLYSIIVFPFVLRQIEFRYFVPAYPFLLIMACYGVTLVTNTLKEKSF